MVQSYICYVTKPIVEGELPECSDSSSSVRAVGGGDAAAHKSKDSSDTAYLQGGNSDPEKPDWSPVSSFKASGGLESKTSSLKITNYPSGRICQL